MGKILIKETKEILNKEYKINRTTYIYDKYNQMCVKGDTIAISRKNKKIIFGTIEKFASDFFVIDMDCTTKKIYVSDIIEIIRC